MTGTSVRAARLRLDMLAQTGPLAQDIVVTGPDRREIGILIFSNMAAFEAGGFALDAEAGAHTNRLLKGEFARRLTERVREVQGSSAHVARAMVFSDPPDMGESEITTKGNLNARKIVDRRRVLLDRLYGDNDPASITF
jgi:feruloyl-CoA synthase